jgi:hypothetical protein
MASPTFFSDGHTPRVDDTRWEINQKILGTLNDIAGGGGGGIPLSLPTWGHGSPEGIVDGNINRSYLDLDSSAEYHKTTAAGTLTGWI